MAKKSMGFIEAKLMSPSAGQFMNELTKTAPRPMGKAIKNYSGTKKKDRQIATYYKG